MFGAQFTIDTEKLPDVAYIVSHNLGLVAGVVVLLVMAVLASIGLEIYRRRYFKKKHEQLAKKYTAMVLTGLSSAITAASYFLIIAKDNEQLLSVFPYLKDVVPQVMAVAYLFYNLGGNKFYQKVSDWLKAWSEGRDAKKALKPATASPTVGSSPDVHDASQNLLT